mgnify:CR=1 FL=1
MTNAHKPMDRHAIVAEIHRCGSSLRKLAKANGLETSACAVALSRGHRAGERVIADFLGVSPASLWPDRYSSSSQAKATPFRVSGASPESVLTTDKERAA